jgi:hypothetical protein
VKRNVFAKGGGRHTIQKAARRANHRPHFRRTLTAFLSRLLQELRAQRQALDLVGAAFDLVGVVGEVNAFDHGPALEHRGRALQLQVLRPC